MVYILKHWLGLFRMERGVQELLANNAMPCSSSGHFSIDVWQAGQGAAKRYEYSRWLSPTVLVACHLVTTSAF